ncbi:MAG: hypothetical protein PF495_19275 [Spirochaetales bacterium]|nr:hypothetical protein [Spirochaetales bacterium]
MMKIRKFMTAGLCLLFALAGICTAVEAEKKESISLEEAVRIADTPETMADGGNIFHQPLQIVKRLRNLSGYEYSEKDAKTWQSCLRDDNRSVYAKLCAAYFLLDQHEETRAFVAAQLKSDDPVSELLELLSTETDEMGRRRIIDDLAEYHDLRAVDPLAKIPRNDSGLPEASNAAGFRTRQKSEGKVD